MPSSLLKDSMDLNNRALFDADRNDEMEHLSCELASAIYYVVLRETTPQNWLDLELSLWHAVKTHLEMCSGEWRSRDEAL
jgi:hypothetical protein